MISLWPFDKGLYSNHANIMGSVVSFRPSLGLANRTVQFIQSISSVWPVSPFADIIYTVIVMGCVKRKRAFEQAHKHTSCACAELKKKRDEEQTKIKQTSHMKLPPHDQRLTVLEKPLERSVEKITKQKQQQQKLGVLTLVLLVSDISCFCKQCWSR